MSGKVTIERPFKCVPMYGNELGNFLLYAHNT